MVALIDGKRRRIAGQVGVVTPAPAVQWFNLRVREDRLAPQPMIDDVAVFHPGVQHSWQTALALQQLGRLNFYATSIFYQPQRWPFRVERHLPAPLRRRAHAEFSRFAGPPLPADKLVTGGMAEWLERIAHRLGARALARQLDRAGNRQFVHRVTRASAHRQPSVLWGFNGSSLETFVHPRHAGTFKVLDRTIGDWRAYNAAMLAVRKEWPDFFSPWDHGGMPDADIKRDDAEYAAADVILTGSPFAADTVRAYAGSPDVAAKVCVLPYCFDEALFGAMPPAAPVSRDRPVRFLFVGQASPRKGIHLLLEAAMRLPRSAATITIVGGLHIPGSTFARYADRVTWRPHVPRQAVPAVMAAADVLVFPSYFEGSALSLLEASAAGLAIIQSPSAGLGVTPETGLMLPALSVEALVSAMMTLVEDRDRLSAFRLAAPAAAAPYRFAACRQRISDLLARTG
jgi:glycosyltransferase involved in cell wall biosynthesis